MKDPIDRWLEENSALFMPVEKDEREIPSPPADKPNIPELSEQQRWDNSMRSMGWTHLVGLKKEGMTDQEVFDEMSKRIVDGLHKAFSIKPKP